MAAEGNGRYAREDASVAGRAIAERADAGPHGDSEGASFSTARPTSGGVNRGLSETLARRRRLYERLLLSRMGGRLSPEDAEDIVSESLTRLESGLSKHPPASGKELGWFARVVLNQGIDFLCARDGRPRNGAAPRPVPVPITGVGDQEIASLSTDEEATTIADLGSVAETREAQELVQRVLANLPPEDVRLITLRHVHAADARRDEVAALAGLTVSEFRWRYGRVVEGHLDHTQHVPSESLANAGSARPTRSRPR